MPTDDKSVNKKKSYYHCFKLSDSEYFLFDVKLDMPIAKGSIAIIKNIQLPKNAVVFYYVVNPSELNFKKTADKTIEIKGDNRQQKPPIRYKKMDKNSLFFHHFRISPTVSVLFDEYFDMPIMYGSNDKINATITNMDASKTIFYYKEDTTVKNSFSLYLVYAGKEPK